MSFKIGKTAFLPIWHSIALNKVKWTAKVIYDIKPSLMSSEADKIMEFENSSKTLNLLSI